MKTQIVFTNCLTLVICRGCDHEVHDSFAEQLLRQAIQFATYLRKCLMKLYENRCVKKEKNKRFVCTDHKTISVLLSVPQEEQASICKTESLELHI